MSLVRAGSVSGRETFGWAIHGTVGGLTVLWGAPGAYKSFVAASMAVAVAGGKPWFGKAVRAGVVLYVVGEGGVIPFSRRLRAAASEVGLALDTLPLWLQAPAVELTGPDTASRLWAEWDAIAPDLVVVDTLSRCLPGDENLQETMQGFVAACDAIRERYSAPVLVLHHANARNQLRGSTVLRGAADVEIQVWRKDGGLHIQANKLKDLDTADWEPEFLAPKRVDCRDAAGELILDEFGDKVTTLVLPETADAGEGVARVVDAFEALVATRPAHQAVGYKEWFEATGLPATSFKRALGKVLEEPDRFHIRKAARGQYRHDEQDEIGMMGTNYKDEISLDGAEPEE